jgi:predicted phage terminase large subunit-like protein
MARTELVLPRPHSGQKVILDKARRFNVLSCGRRFGKTTLGGNLIADVAVIKRLPVGWFAPTYRLLEEAYRDHKRIYAPLITRSVATPYPRIELVTGGSIDYWTLDDPTTVARGRKYGRVIIDEAAMARHLEEAWTEAIRPTLTDYLGDAFFLSTPKGRNYFSLLYDMEKEDEEWISFRLPTTDNPFIDPSEVEAASKALPSIAYRQEFLAEFVDTAGARVSRDWLRTTHISEYGDTYMGVDLAISQKAEADYTATVVLTRLPDGSIYILDAQRIRAPFNQVLEHIKAVASVWTPKIIGIENIQYQASVIQELLRTTKLPVRGLRPDKDKVSRFLPLEARYEQGLVIHSPNLPGWFTDELLSFPIGRHDDAVDALSYAYNVLETRRGWTAV